MTVTNLEPSHQRKETAVAHADAYIVSTMCCLGIVATGYAYANGCHASKSMETVRAARCRFLPASIDGWVSSP